MKRLAFFLVFFVGVVGYTWPAAGFGIALAIAMFSMGFTTGVFLIAWCINKQDANVAAIRESAAEVIKAVTRIRVTKRPVPMAGSVVH